MEHTIYKALPAVSLAQFTDRLIGILPKLTRKLISQERNYFSRGLITLPQLWALRVVAEMSSCTMRDLARALGLKSSTVTGLVDRLVKLGLVKRFNSLKDRRVVLAAITPKGKTILNHVYKEHRRSTTRLFRNVTARERAIYLDILEKIVNKLSTGK